MGDWAAIKERYPAAARGRCRDSGCEFRVAGVEGVLVLKGEEVGDADRKRADCLVFVDDATGRPWVFVVELKSKSVSISEVEEKLQNSGADAQQALEPTGIRPEFRYLVLTQKGLHRDDRRLLQRVRLPGGHMVQREDCGYQLSRALSAEAD